MEGNKLPGPALIALGILAWALVLWIFTLGNPSFVPVARLIFMVLVLPMATVEWLRIKGLLKKQLILPVRLLIIAAALAIWYKNI